VVPAHCSASRWCSGERCSEKARTSSSAAWNSGEPYDGGGAGRTWLPEVRKKVRASPKRGRSGGRALVHIPGPVGTVPVHTASKPSPAARSTTRAPASRPATRAASTADGGAPSRVGGELAVAAGADPVASPAVESRSCSPIAAASFGKRWASTSAEAAAIATRTARRASAEPPGVPRGCRRRARRRPAPRRGRRTPAGPPAARLVLLDQRVRQRVPLPRDVRPRRRASWPAAGALRRVRPAGVRRRPRARRSSQPAARRAGARSV
jgi:hypothetical protein